MHFSIQDLGIGKIVAPKSGKKSSAPGTVEYVGKPRQDKVEVSVLSYNNRSLEEKVVKNLAQLSEYKKARRVTWINVSGVHDAGIIRQIGEVFDIHPLTLEDISNTTQMPKFEEYEDYIFVVLKMLYMRGKQNQIVEEQVSVILTRNCVLLFQESEGDMLDPLRNRLRLGRDKIRKLRSDYLMFSIIDSIIDYYFHVLSDLSDKMAHVEEAVLTTNGFKTQRAIYSVKRKLIYLRKPIWPTRDIMSALTRSGHRLIADETRIYLRDIHDHTIQLIETLTSMREVASGMMELYLSSVGNRTNEVMKVLTIFAAIFIPLTFLAGIYGMNFEYMPELGWHYGYITFWGGTLTITVGMLIYFKRKGWL